MQDSLDLIYSIFDIHNIKNKKKEDIYEYIKLYVQFLYNYDSKNTVIKLVSIIVDFEEYINNGYFYDKKYITINKKNTSYILYIEKKNKCSESISNILNNLSLYNKQYENNDVDDEEDDEVDEVDEDVDVDVYDEEDDEVDEDVENDEDDIDDEDDENDVDDEEDDISKISSSSSIQNLSESSNSIEYTEINFISSVSSNEKKSSQNEIFVLDSLTNIDKFYFINKDLTSCSCEAYKYCKLSVKYCKHLHELNNNFQNNVIFIINKNDKSCNCSRFISHKSCKHINNYNKSIKYLNEIDI